MKSAVTGILIGIALILTLAATTPSLSSPERPSSVITKDFHSRWNVQKDIKAYIDPKIRQGYRVTVIAMSEHGDWQRAIVVMEKY